jgi:hypothetical protein
MSGLGFFAANPVNMELVWVTVALIGTVFVGVLAMWGAKRWWQQPPVESRPENQARSFRVLYDEGLLSQEEFDKITRQLEKKAKAPTPPATPDNPV